MQEQQPGLNQEELERAEIANKYKVADPAKLTKKDGKWFHGDMEVEEWDKMFNKDEGDKYWQR